jgi:hypothetical protein
MMSFSNTTQTMRGRVSGRGMEGAEAAQREQPIAATNRVKRALEHEERVLGPAVAAPCVGVEGRGHAPNKWCASLLCDIAVSVRLPVRLSV